MQHFKHKGRQINHFENMGLLCVKMASCSLNCYFKKHMQDNSKLWQISFTFAVKGIRMVIGFSFNSYNYASATDQSSGKATSRIVQIATLETSRTKSMFRGTLFLVCWQPVTCHWLAYCLFSCRRYCRQQEQHQKAPCHRLLHQRSPHLPSQVARDRLLAKS